MSSNDTFVLYWIDKNSQRRGVGSEGKHEYLAVAMSHKCFSHGVSSRGNNAGLGDVEVVRKGDLNDFMTFLKGQGFREI